MATSLEGLATVSGEVFIAAAVLAGSGYLLTVCTLIFNLKYRTVRIIKMSSPHVNILVNIGGILAYTCCLFYGLANHARVNPSLFCQLRIWLLPTSFTLIFGPLFAKSWRVRRIFQRAPMKRVIIKDYKLYAIVAALLLVDVTILTLWQGFDHMQNLLVTETLELREVESLALKSTETVRLEQCTSNYSPIWITSLYSYKIFTLLYGVYLAWAIRAVQLPTMNESFCIVFSAIFAVLTGSLVGVITFWLRHMVTVVHACLVVGIWASTTVTLTLLYAPKVYYWWKNPDDDVMKLSFATSQILCSPHQSSENVEEEIYHLLAENTSLKRAAAEKEMLIITLQDHVKNARDKLGRLMVDDTKQDSGLDADLSTSSIQDDDHTVRHDEQNTKVEQHQHQHQHQHQQHHHKDVPDSEEKTNTQGADGNQATKRSTAWEVNTYGVVPTSGSIKGKPPLPNSRYPLRHNENYHVNETGLRGRRARMRDSLSDIVHELDTASMYNASFREYRGGRRQRHSDTAPPRDVDQIHIMDKPNCKGIAGSLVQSLNLDDDSDTYSYISNRLTVRNCSCHYDNNGFSSDGETFHIPSRRSSSEESISTLGNDKYYPSFGEPVRRLPPRQKRASGRQKQRTQSRRTSHRNKKEQRPKIYVLQVPRDPCVPSGITFPNYCDHDGTVV